MLGMGLTANNQSIWARRKYIFLGVMSGKCGHFSTSKCFEPSFHQTLVLLCLANPMLKFVFHLWTYPPIALSPAVKDLHMPQMRLSNLPNFKKPRPLFGWFFNMWIFGSKLHSSQESNKSYVMLVDEIWLCTSKDTRWFPDTAAGRPAAVADRDLTPRSGPDRFSAFRCARWHLCSDVGLLY
jgi:hypothetical protein